jgi:hypothetical protein
MSYEALRDLVRGEPAIVVEAAESFIARRHSSAGPAS